VLSSMQGTIFAEPVLVARIMALFNSCRTQSERLAFADHKSRKASKAAKPSLSLPGMESPALISHSSNQTSIPESWRCEPIDLAIGLSALL